jgi:hypothetical protein
MADQAKNDPKKDNVDKAKEEEEELGCCAKCWYGYCAIVVWTCKVLFVIYIVHIWSFIIH